MNNSHSKPANAAQLNPRKKPSQPRSAQTVEAILDGAAHILEQLGLDGYTTNAIAARAGVSIGSLYQYFPSKDAVTIALIEREMAALVQDATQALRQADRGAALRQLIGIAVDYQLRRPTLAALLDFEQHRLAAVMPTSGNARAMHTEFVAFLRQETGPFLAAPELMASEIMAIISALTDAAGRAGNVEPVLLAQRIAAAVGGYLSAACGWRQSPD